MTKPRKRNYTQKTVKVIFALSRNQCAYPGCKNRVVLPSTEESGELVLSQICHIYALSEEGPRGKAGLTESELNAPDNLILFCPTHHVMVDGQYERFPAELLKEWKKAHEQEALVRDLEKPETFLHANFPRALVDRRIEDEAALIRRSRFFPEFDTVRSSLELARRLLEGELSGGTDAIRSRALAWCARYLSRSEELAKAEEYLKRAKTLGACAEIEIAEAFIFSQKGKKALALTTLASITSPLSRSAALMIVAHHEGTQGAIDWLRTARIEAANLDPDGKSFLLARYLEASDWDTALQCLDVVTDEDLREAPVLHHMMAITRLLSVVPAEFRVVVRNQVPLQAAGFPLASDAVAIAARRLAHQHFVKGADVARQLNCLDTETIDEEYGLWLELSDPEKSDDGRRRLEAKLRDPRYSLRLVPLGLQFGVKLDLDAVEREIERKVALSGMMTQEAAIARFALAFTQKTPEKAASYIDRHIEELASYIDKKAMQFLQIEMLSQARLPQRAKECLDNLLAEGISDIEESRLRRIIAEAEGTDPVEARREQFRNTDSLGDLVSLVDELESRQQWDGVTEYGEILFERTRSLRDAERLARGLNNAHQNDRLIAFLKDNKTLVSQSIDLKILYCWSLYYDGSLVDAREELAKLSDVQGHQNYRALQVNLGIALGDWNFLSAFVANESREKDKRSAQDLMNAAQIALDLSLPNAKELVFAAASKGSSDARLLAAGYFLAAKAGWEDDSEVLQWLHKAAELSGDDGPIQKMSLKDILERKPEWDRRESETWAQLSRGNIPMFIAAELLNKSLIDLTLFPALANPSKNDPRRRSTVSAYSGKRKPTPIGAGRVAGIDATALLTLSFLELLDQVLDAFDKVYIPHSTLAWLFEEKRKAAFHQPSRIRDAHQLRHLVITDELKKLVPSTVPDSDLSAQVGDDLAQLIAEAEKVREDDRSQRIVVRPHPVYRVSSLMEEEADLTAHVSVLSSCQAIVDKLRLEGQLTAEEEKKARAYLKLHEKPWPNQPEIVDGAVLYLDDLAITYLLHLGILQKLHAAGFKPIACPAKVHEANELISYEGIATKVNEAIERVRVAVNSRIESGKIAVGKRALSDEETEERAKPEHPTAGLLRLAKHCDVIIADDRFINQHENIDADGSHKPIFSTLDVLDGLTSRGELDAEENFEYRTHLRRAGYLFVPVSANELSRHLGASMVKNDTVVETAELKAIRENVLCARMSTLLQLPDEATWLDALLKTFTLVLKDLWKADADLSAVRSRCDWIIDQIDVRGWAHRLSAENSDSMVKIGRGEHIVPLLLPPISATTKVQDEYWRWCEDRILEPIKEQYHDLYLAIIDWQKRRIAEVADMDLTRVSQNGE